MMDAASLVGFVLMLAFSLTGAYIWLRWGWTGVEVIWAKREEIDARVRQDLEVTVIK